jgi:hypothetical protein
MEEDKARQARLLAIFNSLSGAHKEMVLRASEVIQQTGRETDKRSKQEKEKIDFENE